MSRRPNRSSFFCFSLMVFHFQAKETAPLWSSTLDLILTVGYNAWWKLIHAEWPAVLTSLWENKMVWLQLPTHKTRKKKRKKKEIRDTEHARNGLFPQPLVYEDWDFLVGTKLGSCIILSLGCLKHCTSWGQGQTWCLECSCKIRVYIAAEGVAGEWRKCKLISNANTKATVCIKN